MRKIVARAPGRINLIGEHTDYNDGWVLPAAIDRVTSFRLQRNGLPTSCRVTALDPGETLDFELDHLTPIRGGGWRNYVLGVVDALQTAGAPLRGFGAEFESEVPIGSGLSSSAALTCSLAVGLRAMFELELGDWELIRAAQWAEHHYVGTKCGIMDPFASIKGRRKQAMLLDCRSLEFSYVNATPPGYRWVLIDSGVKHRLAESAYNTRRAECEAAAEKLADRFAPFRSLRDLTPSLLAQASDFLSPTLLRRCRHVFSENTRVHDAVEALENGNAHALGRLLAASHASLRDDYEVSCSELDVLVDLARQEIGIAGSRMMGGGFGGCTLNLVHEAAFPNAVESVKEAYERKTGNRSNTRWVETGGGAEITAGEEGIRS